MNHSLQRDAALALAKLAYSLDEVAELSGRCRSSLYELIDRGELRAVKSGRRTLILVEDLRSWMDNLCRLSQGARPENGATPTVMLADMTR